MFKIGLKIYFEVEDKLFKDDLLSCRDKGSQNLHFSTVKYSSGRDKQGHPRFHSRFFHLRSFISSQSLVFLNSPSKVQ